MLSLTVFVWTHSIGSRPVNHKQSTSQSKQMLEMVSVVMQPLLYTSVRCVHFHVEVLGNRKKLKHCT
jgi:hypothetical protein